MAVAFVVQEGQRLGFCCSMLHLQIKQHGFILSKSFPELSTYLPSLDPLVLVCVLLK